MKKNHKLCIKNNKLVLKRHQRLKSEQHNVFTEEINKIELSSYDDKIMKSIDWIEIYVYETSKYSTRIRRD